MTSTIYTDTTVRLVGEFRNFSGILIDPTTITVRHQDPNGTITTSTYPGTDWGHPVTGVYTFDVEVPTEGTWLYSYLGTGACDTYGESKFIVNAKGF